MSYKPESIHVLEYEIQENTHFNSSFWKLLIIDTDPNLHKSIKLAIAKNSFKNRELEIHSAYSKKESKKLLNEHTDFALIFLDLTLKENNPDLELLSYIRKTLKNKFTRIIVCAEQLEVVPEERVLVEYDILDYKKKSSLNKKRLLLTVYNAIQAYQNLVNSEARHTSLLFTRTGLETIINASNQLFNAGSLTEFSSLLVEQLSALLAKTKDIKSACASGLVASVNSTDGMNAILGETQLKASVFQKTEPYHYFEEAYTENRSFFINDSFVGCFKAKHGNAILVYLKHCKPADSLTQSLLDIFSVNISSALESILLEKEISEAQEDLIFRLGGFIETRSRETGNHVKRLAKLSYILALELGLPEEEAKLIRKASALHDLGKVVIPDNILKKPGKLTAEEYEQIKQHSKFGYEVLNNSPRPLLKAAAIIAHQHHERYDGNGYPQGLEGEEIHFYARIVSVIDVFDALMHNRYYKNAWDFNKVMEVLKEQRGKQFDPEIFDAFVRIIPQALDIVSKHNDAAMN